MVRCPRQRQINKNIKKDAPLVLGFQKLMVNSFFCCNTVKYCNTTKLVLLYAASTEGTLV